MDYAEIPRLDLKSVTSTQYQGRNQATTAGLEEF